MSKSINNKKSANKKSVSKKQKKKNISEKEKIFKEISGNFEKTEYNIRKKKKKKNKKKSKIMKFILTVMLIIFIAFTGIFIKRMNENGWTLGGFVATILGHDANTLSKLSRMNILVVGQSQNLTDTLLICSYDPKTQDVDMLSIPRDTFVGKNKNYATASDKINAIYQYDPNKLLTKVNGLTGLDIKYYVKVDTQGLRDLVDSVGGIYFDVPIDMDYDDSSQDLHIHLKAGYQLLDGDKAEQVVRFRHNNDGSSYPIEYGDQDLGRMKTQRAFITEIIKQMAKPESLTKIDDYIKIANNHLETNFNLWSLKDYAPYVLDFDVNNIKTATLPGAPEKCNDVWVYIANKKQTQKVVEELFKTKLTAEQEQNAKIKINILNGTKDEMKLNNLKNLLKESGYTVVSTGVTSLTETTTIINRTGQDEEVSESLKDIIGVGLISNLSSSQTGSDFTIIIGSDY